MPKCFRLSRYLVNDEIGFGGSLVSGFMSLFVWIFSGLIDQLVRENSIDSPERRRHSPVMISDLTSILTKTTYE